MKTLLIALLSATLFGCTSYGIERGTDDNGNLYTKVNVKSTRDLEQPRVDYSREGQDAEFHFSAASVDNNTEVMVGAFSGMMGMMMEMVQKMMLMNVAPHKQSGVEHAK